jgi:hypothetical protein
MTTVETKIRRRDVLPMLRSVRVVSVSFRGGRARAVVACRGRTANTDKNASTLARRLGLGRLGDIWRMTPASRARLHEIVAEIELRLREVPAYERWRAREQKAKHKRLLQEAIDATASICTRLGIKPRAAARRMGKAARLAWVRHVMET